MKKVVLLLTLLISFNQLAQEIHFTKKQFVRVFNLQGKKIGKGNIYTVNDSLLVLKEEEKLKKLYVKEIGSIKTKRSGGYNFLIGATSGFVAGTILGVTNPPTESSGGTFTWAGGSSESELKSGLTFGIISGTIVGGVSALFKNSKKYIIDADTVKLKSFVETVK